MPDGSRPAETAKTALLISTEGASELATESSSEYGTPTDTSADSRSSSQNTVAPEPLAEGLAVELALGLALGLALDDGVALGVADGVPTPEGLDVFVIVFESSVIAPFVLMTWPRTLAFAPSVMAAGVIMTPAIDEDAPTVTAPSTIQKTFAGWAPFTRVTTSFAPNVSAPWMRSTNTELAFA
jgi:hypothetical protein